MKQRVRRLRGLLGLSLTAAALAAAIGVSSARAQIGRPGFATPPGSLESAYEGAAPGRSASLSFPGGSGRTTARLASDAFEPREPRSSTPQDHAARDRNLRAVGYSILLPGLAQYQMGHKTRGLVYMTAEAAFWTAFFTYRIQGEIREDSYLQMAGAFAGARDLGSRSDDYYKRIGSWLSSDRYDELVLRDARAIYGDDLAARDAYFQANRTPADQAWQWQSIAALRAYREKRSDSQRAFKRSRDMIGLAVANRLVAVVDAVLLGRGRAESDTGMRLHLQPARIGNETIGRLGLTRHFP